MCGNMLSSQNNRQIKFGFVTALVLSNIAGRRNEKLKKKKTPT